MSFNSILILKICIYYIVKNLSEISEIKIFKNMKISNNLNINILITLKHMLKYIMLIFVIYNQIKITIFHQDI